MNVTLTLPVEWLQSCHPMFESLKANDSLRRRMVTELLYQCQEQFGVRVVIPAPDSPTAATLRVPLFMPDRLARYVTAVAKQSGLMPGATAKALLHLLWKQRPATSALLHESTAPSPLAALLKKLSTLQERPEQVAAFGAMEDALGNGKVGLVEASTGVGKTLAAVFAAARWIQREQQSCCIAVPTLALLRQVIAEYRRIETMETLPQMRTFFGRREFISQHAAAMFCETMGERWLPATKWLRDGARPSVDDGLEPAWLVPELRRIEPDFPANEVCLTELTAGDDAGYVAYRQQFSRESDEPSLLLCTHAMLAQDMRLRLRAAARDEEFAAVNAGVFELIATLSKLTGDELDIAREQLIAAKRQLGEVMASSEGISGILPSYGALIVDEAHALESNFSSALSEYIPLRKIVRLMAEYRKEGGKITAAAIEEASAAIATIQQHVPNRSDFVSMSSTNLAQAKDALGKLVALLAPLTSIKPRSMSAERALLLAELRRAANLIKLAMNQGSGRSYLRLSPQRAFPQLYVGRDNVESVLSLLWGSVKAGIALSATLYLYRSTGPHSGYVSGLLGIPDARRSEYAPIEATWLNDCIESIDTPNGSRALRLRPPTRRDRLDDVALEREKARWLDEVAKEIHTIHSSSHGGVLVLNTSYETVAGLRDRLLKQHPRIICAAEGFSVASQAKRFLEVHDNGEKALWLAVGGAWTGLDIGGHEPRVNLLGKPMLNAEQDNVLCDLVIPRLPFGTNNSITHLRRILTRPSIPWDLLDAGFRFRQALGRLVRRQGLPRNRRIWVLDGRLAEPDAPARLAVFLAPIRRIRDRIAERGTR